MEVGTTNRTYLEDYENAVTANTAAFLKVHTSNYQITGFTHEAELTDTNGKGKTVHYKDIFRFWNPHVESKKDSSLSVSNMTYKDMVTFSLWRKYEDPKGTNVESTTEAPTNP